MARPTCSLLKFSRAKIIGTITPSQKRGSIRSKHVPVVTSVKYQTRRLHVVIVRRTLKPQRGVVIVVDVLQPFHKRTTSRPRTFDDPYIQERHMRSRPNPHNTPGEAPMSSYCNSHRTIVQYDMRCGVLSYNTGDVMEQDALVRWPRYEALLSQNVLIGLSPSTKKTLRGNSRILSGERCGCCTSY